MKTLLMIIAILTSSQVGANTCWNNFAINKLANSTGQTEIEVVVERTSHIFIGEVQSIIKQMYLVKGKEPYLVESTTSFHVEESIKGTLSAEVTIYSESDCACKYNFVPGVTYLVLASEDKGKHQIYNCSYIRPLERSLVTEIKEVIDINKKNK